MENIYEKALQMLKDRENYWGNKAHSTNDLNMAQNHLSMASAYYSAYWILHYAMESNWECLKQFDYYQEA